METETVTNPRKDMKPDLTFEGFQSACLTWRRKNFDSSEMGYHALLGVMEELGELAHSHLKQLQGIRGTPEEHEAAGKDAVGDILVFLSDYCSQREWPLQDIAVAVLNEVQKRDWKKDKLKGGT